MITFIALVLTAALKPYVDPGLVRTITAHTSHTTLHPSATMFCLLQDRLQILSLIVTLLTLFYGILLNTNLQQFQLNDKNERSLQVIIFQDRTKMSFKPAHAHVSTAYPDIIGRFHLRQ